MAVKWQNGGSRTAVDIRIGGPGNNWQFMDLNAVVDAPQGGGRSVNRQWGRDPKGGLLPRGFNYTSNPNPWTFNVSYPLRSDNFLRRLDCPFDIRVRERCDQPDNILAYAQPGIIGFQEVINTNWSHSDPIAAMDGQEADEKKQMAGDAVVGELYTGLAHDDNSGTTSDFALNKIISVGLRICAGDCGDERSEEDAFWAVSDQDSTPGYSGNATSRFYYRQTKVDGWSNVPIDPFTLADATDVIQLGPNVVVFSASKAPAYARFQDILNGVTAPNLWATATGFTGITSTNFPKAAWAANAMVAYAVGNGGRIWATSDGGISWTLIFDTGVLTSQNLNAVDGVSNNLVYFGGNAGVFGRIVGTSSSSNSYATSGSLIVVKDVNGTMSSNINVVRTPATRGKEVYLGTAGGEIWRSKNATDTVVTWKNMTIPGKGSGSITDLVFIGYRGDVAFFIQTNASNYSRVWRDFSGGGFATDVEPVGDYTNPGNFKMNSIAAANVNYALTVGEVHNSYAFMGTIRSVNS